MLRSVVIGIHAWLRDKHVIEPGLLGAFQSWIGSGFLLVIVGNAYQPHPIAQSVRDWLQVVAVECDDYGNPRGLIDARSGSIALAEEGLVSKLSDAQGSLSLQRD